jgi:glycogen phosphorylase
MVNQDPQARSRMQVLFLPDYNVKQAQHIYPAADLSEQISTAGYEASGTSNMKFALNGALTIGTLDGANIEIREEVGAENFFLFGLTVDEVKQLRTRGYHPRNEYQRNPRLKAALDAIGDGTFSKGDRGLFRPLLDSLLNHDPYLVLADYQAYVDCQDQVSLAYRDQDHWTRMSILNIARMGKFSSDRAILDYCEKVWGTKQVEVPNNANHA